MSGNLWMFSDKLDDEDIEILKHEFITYYQGADYYGLGLKAFKSSDATEPFHPPILNVILRTIMLVFDSDY